MHIMILQVYSSISMYSFQTVLVPLYTIAVVHQIFSGVACRKCLTNGTWDIPNFDSCTNRVYEQILAEVCRTSYNFPVFNRVFNPLIILFIKRWYQTYRKNEVLKSLLKNPSLTLIR